MLRRGHGLYGDRHQGAGQGECSPRWVCARGDVDGNASSIVQMTRGALSSAAAHILPGVACERATHGRGHTCCQRPEEGQSWEGLEEEFGKEWSYPEGFMEEVGLGE